MPKHKTRNTLPGPILNSEGMGAFLGHICWETKAFWLLAPPKQMAFLTISDKNICPVYVILQTKQFHQKLTKKMWPGN